MPIDPRDESFAPSFIQAATGFYGLDDARAALEWLTMNLPAPRVIYDRDGRTPYLSRWYLTDRPTMPDGSDPFDATGAPRWGLEWNDRRMSVYLHKFHRSDEAIEMHSHPWGGVSIILSGGYEEERRGATGEILRRTYRPGDMNVIAEETCHRVDLLEIDAWSIFIVGPKVSSWGFWDRKLHTFTPWRQYVARRRGVDPSTFGDSIAKKFPSVAELFQESVKTIANGWSVEMDACLDRRARPATRPSMARLFL